MKKALLLFVIIVMGAFFIPNTSNALQLIDSQINFHLNADFQPPYNTSFWLGQAPSNFILTNVSLSLIATSSDINVFVRYTCFDRQASSPPLVLGDFCNATPFNVYSDTVLVVGGLPEDNYTFTFSATTTPLISGKWYLLEIFGENAVNKHLTVFGGSEQFLDQCVVDGVSYCSSAGVAPFFVYNAEFGFGITAQGIATSSGLFSGQTATTTLDALAEQCSQMGNIFSEGMCVAFSFLFVPSEKSMGQFSKLTNLISIKFPFSYINSVAETWKGLQATTSSAVPTFSYGLGSLGIGSTTAMGNILPDFDVLSASTMQYWLPATAWDPLKALVAIAIILVLISDIYFTSRNLLK